MPKRSAEEIDLRGKIKSDFPKHTLDEALSVPTAIEEANGGRPLPPTDIAIAMDVSPGGSDFRIRLSSSFKYNLTVGSYKQERISLADLGRRIVAPTSPEDRHQALFAAAITPETFRRMYEYFRGKKIPDPQFLQNTLVRDFDVPREHSARCIDIFLANMGKAGLVRNATTGKWLAAEPLPMTNSGDQGLAGEGFDSSDPDNIEVNSQTVKRATINPRADRQTLVESRRVFVTHGKNKDLVPQLKELLSFGQFIPVVSIERESVAKPVPDKVMDDLRSCSAAIIHVDAEREMLSPDGTREIVLNPNVLIEIGAAMALYGRKFILLVQDGVRLPTNLQGLYEVRYAGVKLDGDATLRLLKAFNDFKSPNTSSGVK